MVDRVQAKERHDRVLASQLRTVERRKEKALKETRRRSKVIRANKRYTRPDYML